MNARATSKKTVIAIIRDNESDIVKYGVRRLGLFGSFVRKEENPRSDIDVLVEFDPKKKTYSNFIQLAFLLEDSFGRRVELVAPEALSPHIGPRILDEVEYVI